MHLSALKGHTESSFKLHYAESEWFGCPQLHCGSRLDLQGHAVGGGPSAGLWSLGCALGRKCS